MATPVLQPAHEAELPSDDKEIILKEVAAIPITEGIAKNTLAIALATPPFVPLKGSLNLRDIGLLPDSPIKPGLLYRSGSLHNLPSEALNKLRDDLGIKTVFDLRHISERTQWPEPEIEGVEMIWCQTPTPPRRDDPSAFEADGGIPGFVDMYRDLLKLYGPQYKRILEHILQNPNSPILWHCTAGKDRAGLFPMLLLSLAGASRELIAYDYSLSRIGIESDRDTLQKNLEKWLGPDAMKMPGMINLGSTRPEIAYAVLEMVEKEFGGFREFCEKELGMSREDLEKIAEMIKA